MKILFVVYENTKYLIEKIHICGNNTEHPFASKTDNRRAFRFTINTLFI